MTKSTHDELLGDVLAYGLAAAVGQLASHLVLARDPKLPASWEQLVARYTAGSAIVAGAVSLYVIRHPNISAASVVLLHWGVLVGSGGAVAALHFADWLHERAVEAAEARGMDARYAKEDAGHVASPAPPRAPLPLPIRGRG